jgi:hypothetical protein
MSALKSKLKLSEQWWRGAGPFRVTEIFVLLLKRKTGFDLRHSVTYLRILHGRKLLISGLPPHLPPRGAIIGIDGISKTSRHLHACQSKSFAKTGFFFHLGTTDVVMIILIRENHPDCTFEIWPILIERFQDILLVTFFVANGRQSGPFRRLAHLRSFTRADNSEGRPLW